MKNQWMIAVLVLSLLLCTTGCRETGDETKGSQVSGSAVNQQTANSKQQKYANGRYCNSTNFYGKFDMGSKRRENMKSKADGIFQYSLDGKRLKEIEIRDMRELFYVDDQWIYFDITPEDSHSLYRAPIQKVKGNDEIHLEQKECLVSSDCWVDLLYIGEKYLVYYDLESCYQYHFATKKATKVKGVKPLEKADDEMENFFAFFSEDGGSLEGEDNYFYYDTITESLVSFRDEVGKKPRVLDNSGNLIFYELEKEDFSKLYCFDKSTKKNSVFLEKKQVEKIVLPKKKSEYYISNVNHTKDRVYVTVSETTKDTGETSDKLLWCAANDTKQWHYEEKLYEYMKKIYTQDKEDYGMTYKTGCLGDIRYPYIYIENEIHNTHWAMNPFVLYNLETGEGKEYTGNDPEYDWF